MIKNAEEIEKMRKAGTILGGVLSHIQKHAREGVSLSEIDAAAKQRILDAGAQPSFLGYQPSGAKKPYPASICASVNDVVVHGVPTDNVVLKEGDIAKIDIGVKWQGYHADSAITFGIGNISLANQKLIDTTREALDLGIKKARVGNTLGDIGHVIQIHIEKNGFQVVKGLTGHGIGKELHEEPSVLNEGNPGEGMKLKEGMVIAIEPMVGAGTGEIKQLADEGYATADGSMSAHFEHTVLITSGEPEVLTARE